MSKKNNTSVEEERFEVVEATLGKTERYIEDNQKSLTIIVLAIVVIVGGYFGFKKFIVEPQEQEASEIIFTAENYFAVDSFNLALNGNNAYLGFVDIAKEYSLTKTGNLANYYAESYKEYNQIRKTKHLKKSIEWLTKRVREADTRVIDAEKNLFAFKKNNQVILTEYTIT